MDNIVIAQRLSAYCAHKKYMPRAWYVVLDTSKPKGEQCLFGPATLTQCNHFKTYQLKE